MAATVSNQKILNDDETVDGGLMAPCRRGENADSEISSAVSSDERFINKYVPPPRAFANSKENKDEGGKRRGTPKLDCRRAKSSSDAASAPPSPRARSLDISNLRNRTSFRIRGIDGEFDEIWPSLGLSGPDDFSIPAAAWEARKFRSSLDLPPRSRLHQKILNDDETVDGGWMAPCRRGESADSEISSDVSSDERFINKYVPPPRAFANSEENKDEGGKDRKPDYFHVSTPRGQATDSHSLAERERVRTEKISERLKYLQDLVPGCSKIVGKSERLDEIIKYVQSFETQYLSTKAAAVTLSLDLNVDSFFAKDVKKASQSPITNKELAHCGHATDSHSVAERVRKENFRNRLKYLEDLVPGCNKIKGCVGRLNKIIDYIEYLQVECFSYQSAEQFQSTKVAVVNPSPDFNIDSFFAKEVFPASTSMEFYAPDNGAHLGRPYQSGPNSEKKDMREQLSEECLTKSVHSFDDTTKQKSLPDLRTLTPLGQYFADEKILNQNKKIFNGAERFEDLMPPFTRGENPCPEISFHVRSKFTNKCLPHVFAISEENELNDKVVKFYSRQGTGSWGSLKHVHPATLEELGPENKGIISDLLRFVMEKEFYKKVGKAWTGFYSLYEPPGTDRLSLIGAMANYLEFDIYNLDLTSLPSIEELKKMLSSIRNRSLIAIQDFNHWPGMLSKFKTELTVPCLLKIFYHLFSSCGDEHVIVFTTQHRDRHDAALLCPVGTDMHIYAPSPQPLALPEEDDEIVGGGERVKVYSGLLQAKLDEESTDLGMEVEEGKGVKNLEEGMLEITKELCQEAEEEENQEFEVEEGNQEFTDPEKLETQDALLIQEREEEAKVEDRREMADDFMRTLGRCEKLNSEISLIQQYLAHASAHSKKNEDNDKSSVKVYSRRGRGCWDSMKLEHLATLEELGMDPENKGEISDLLGFVRMKEFYKKEGKAWKKGYLLNEPKDETHVLSGKWVVEIQWNLFWFVRNKEFYKTKGDTWKRVYWLYEPSDTERSSLSVATANYLKLYTCDLDLTSIPSKLEQKDTLLSTRERSSIVIKDFDFKNESAISFPDGEHILSLSEKKIVRETLKRKCRSMSILSLEDHKQHVDRRWEDAAKSHGAKRICRQLVIHRLSTAKRIHRQHGIHRRPFQRSATGLPNGGHILPLSEKKIMRKTLKRKCRSMSVLSLVDHQQHVDRRWEDAAKNIGVKRIFRQLVILRVSIAKPICRQHGIHHRWPYQQDRGTMKGYTLGDKRPVEVIRLSMDGKLVSSLQVIYISWLGRFSPPPSTLPGGEIVGHIALSSSQFATTNSIAQRVGQDQSGSASFDSENERTREQEDPEEMYTSITSDDLRRLYGKMNRKDAAAGLGVSVATFKRKCREFGIKRWPHVRGKKVGRPPDQHGERNTSTACKMPLHNVHAGMEGEPVGQNQEANEFRRDFMEHSIALNAENDSIIAVYSETDVAMGYSKWAFQLEGQTMQSTTHPYRNNLVFSQPQIASIEVPNENMGSLQDRRDLLASQVVAPQQEPLLEGHVFGFGNWTVGSCSDLAPTQPMHPFSHATGSSENLENLLASVEEHLMEGNVSGSSMSDPALNQPMHTIHHTMATIPHMMPLPTERQDTGSVKIKATYEDTNIKFQFPLTSGIKELKEVMSMILERKLGSFKVEYKDVDGEWILMGLDEHVREYLQLLLGNKVTTELKVQDKVPNTMNFCDNCRCNNRRSVKRKKP